MRCHRAFCQNTISDSVHKFDYINRTFKKKKKSLKYILFSPHVFRPSINAIQQAGALNGGFSHTRTCIVTSHTRMYDIQKY